MDQVALPNNSYSGTNRDNLPKETLNTSIISTITAVDNSSVNNTSNRSC